jgi:hypothetical protein
MKKILLIILMIAVSFYAEAQCSICTKTASQLGEGPAKALNGAIVYLMLTPFLLMGVIGYRWWKREKQIKE